jgi:hypothetical protein
LSRARSADATGASRTSGRGSPCSAGAGAAGRERATGARATRAAGTSGRRPGSAAQPSLRSRHAPVRFAREAGVARIAFETSATQRARRHLCAARVGTAGRRHGGDDRRNQEKDSRHFAPLSAKAFHGSSSHASEPCRRSPLGLEVPL